LERNGLKQALDAIHRATARVTGRATQQHLDYYLDEFTFRFNRRRSSARGLLFHRLAQQAVAVGPAPYHSLISGATPVLG